MIAEKSLTLTQITTALNNLHRKVKPKPTRDHKAKLVNINPLLMNYHNLIKN